MLISNVVKNEKITETDETFNFDLECIKPFNQLKHTFTPILNFDESFRLTADASVFTIGALLSQGLICRDLPIAYESATLCRTKINSLIKRELLTIV